MTNNRFKIWISISLIMLGFGITIGQPIGLTFNHLTESDGLLPSDKYFITQDSHGLMWIGTDNGLMTFEGKNLNKYFDGTVAENTFEKRAVTSNMYEDRNHNLWFTTVASLNCLLRNSGTLLSYKINDELWNYRAFFNDDAGNIWIQAEGDDELRAYTFNIKQLKFSEQFPLVKGENYLMKNANNDTIIITTDMPKRPGMVFTNSRSKIQLNVEFIETSEGRQRFYSSPTTCVFQDDHQLWFGLYGGLGRYNPGDTMGVVELTTTPDIETDIGWVHSIIAFDNDNLLVAADAGLFQYDKKMNKFIKHFPPKSSSPYALNLINPNVLYSNNQHIWIGGADQEVAFVHRAKHKFQNIELLKGRYITSITQDVVGNIWCSTKSSGVYVFDDDKNLLLHTDEILTPGKEFSTVLPYLNYFIRTEDGNWWGNNESYFFLWNAEEQKFEFKESYFIGVGNTEEDQINICYTLGDGTNLVTIGNQIFELRLNTQVIELEPYCDLSSFELQTIKSIFETAGGDLLIGDETGRLVILEIENCQINKIADFPNIGICNAYHDDMAENKIWVATSNGVVVINKDSFTWELQDSGKWKNRSGAYYDVLKDERGLLWFSSQYGLVRFNPKDSSCHSFSIADGLMSNLFNKHAFIISEDPADVWIGGQNGVNYFNPSDVKLLNNKPDILLANLLVNDEPYQLENSLHVTDDLKFAYTENTLSFEFVALDFSDPTSNQYLYQMQGYDEQPVGCGNNGFARYANLPAGNYVFNAWATNSDHVMNEHPLALAITIIPPYYQTWWFMFLCFLLATGLIYLIFRYRLNEALKVERLRVKISSDLHDDVGGLLSGLAMQSEILELTADEKVKPKLQRISELSRSAMSRMRDTVWAIDARKDKFENLIDRMNEHAEEVLAPKSINSNVSTIGLKIQKTLPTDIRQNIYLIFKEALTNVAKHSNATQVDVQLSLDKNEFTMKIQDNGSVKEKAYKTTGSGIANMKMRAKKLNGVLTFDNTDGYKMVLRIDNFH